VTARVVDTNVILVANKAHQDASPECVLACVELLYDIMENGCLVLDDQYRILREYQRKTEPVKDKGVGDMFVKWALQNIKTPAKVRVIPLTELEPEIFAEFPCKALEAVFDRQDRKFAAVSHAHADRPPIAQACDSKWLEWWPPLLLFGVRIIFVCREDICRFYAAKNPGRPVPPLP
jgi:hypothetical protein